MYQHNLILQLLQPELMIPVEYFFTCNTIYKNFQYIEKTWQDLSKKSMGIILVTTIQLHIPSVNYELLILAKVIARKEALCKPKSHIPANIPHATFHIPNISHHQYLMSQTSHIPTIPHLTHPSSPTSYIPNIMHLEDTKFPHPQHRPQYPTSPTPHTPNISCTQLLTFLTSYILRFHIPNISHPEHITSSTSHIPNIQNPQHPTAPNISYSQYRTFPTSHIPNIHHP